MKTILLWPAWARNIEAVVFYFPRTIFHDHTHGPTKWPWWKIFSIDPVSNSTSRAFVKGWNIWVYTRWHKAVCFEFDVSYGLSKTEGWPKMEPYQFVAIAEKLRAARKLQDEWGRKWISEHLKGRYL